MKFDNLCKSMTNIYKKMSTFGKVLLFITILLILTVFFRGIEIKSKEGFEQREKFVFKKGNDVYDDFYSTIYDHLLHNEHKNNYEIMNIFKKTNPTDKSVILDIGCGTGHHVGKIYEKVPNITGIDISPSMIKQALQNYPDKKFIVGDVMNSHEFGFNTFTHILCLYFTIYFFQNKRQFFDNCMDWLMPGGYLIVHIVDPVKFDPILPPGNPLFIVSPQKYAKKRITSTKINFNKFVYHSNFNYDESSEIGKFEEKFKFDDGKTRKHEHVLYMEDNEKIIAIAQQCGFILHANIDMLKCAYEHQYLYIFMKPG